MLCDSSILCYVTSYTCYVTVLSHKMNTRQYNVDEIAINRHNLLKIESRPCRFSNLGKHTGYYKII